eukprot:8843158-Heterocapsa_arctica.AAC.1
MGDSFLNAKKKTWTNVQTPEGATEPLPCAFCQFILTLINQLMRLIMNNVKEEETWRKRGRVKKRSWTKQQVRDGINKCLPDFSVYVDTQEKNINVTLRYLMGMETSDMNDSLSDGMKVE